MCSHTVTFWYGTAFSDSLGTSIQKDRFPEGNPFAIAVFCRFVFVPKTGPLLGSRTPFVMWLQNRQKATTRASATNRPNLSLANKILVLLELSIKANDGLVADGPQLLAHTTDEELVVGDHNHAALELVQRVRKRLDRLCALYSLPALTNIEMVGGLIQHQNVRSRVRDHGK